MIIAAETEDFAALLRGGGPRSFRLPDTPIAPPAVLEMLAELEARVRQAFMPAAWLVVEADEVVGLCSVVRSPSDGVIEIGYGIAPSRQGRGNAGRAIAEIVAWASRAPSVTAITAETGVDNLPSQRVLVRNGFARIGERFDDEDGQLICWRCPT